MNDPRAIHGPAGDGWDETVSLTILVVCEDAACQRHALNMMERVNSLLPLDTRTLTAIREFDEFQPLENPPANEVRPDIVLVAAHGNGRLPATVKDWLGRWASGSHGLTCALAAVLDRRNWQSVETVETIQYLRNLATNSGIDWLEVGGANLTTDEQFRQDLKLQASQVSSTLDEIIRTPRPPAQPGKHI